MADGVREMTAFLGRSFLRGFLDVVLLGIGAGEVEMEGSGASVGAGVEELDVGTEGSVKDIVDEGEDVV